jgi:hypothetical protein
MKREGGNVKDGKPGPEEEEQKRRNFCFCPVPLIFFFANIYSWT